MNAKRTVYDYVDESSIDENLKCSICKEPFQDPVNTPCDHTFCQSCIEQWIDDDNNSCPACRRPLSIHSLMPITRIVGNLLARLQVKCQACGEKSIQREGYIDHITKTCPKTIVPCSALDILCPWKGTRHSLQNHIDRCPYEQIRSVLTHLIKIKEHLSEKLNDFLIEKEQHESQIENLQETEQDLLDTLQLCDKQLTEKNRQILEFQANELIYKKQNKILTQQLKEARSLVEPTTQTIIFDSLDSSIKSSCDQIPENLFGYKWINGCYITKHHASTHHPNKSWLIGFPPNNTHTCIAYNKDGKSLILQKYLEGHQFSINSFQVIPIHHKIMELMLTGRRTKQEIYSRTIHLSSLVTYVVDLNWLNIDELEMKPRGIIPITRYKHSQPHFALISLQLTDTELF